MKKFVVDFKKSKLTDATSTLSLSTAYCDLAKWFAAYLSDKSTSFIISKSFQFICSKIKLLNLSCL